MENNIETDEVIGTPEEELAFWQASAKATVNAASIVLHEEYEAGRMTHQVVHELLAKMGQISMQLLLGIATVQEMGPAEFEAKVAEEQATTVVIEN
jgi:hypothetical protein